MRKLLIGLTAALLALASAPAWAATQTTNYNLNKPSVGADASQWGAYINGDMDTIDSTMKSISNVANAACPLAGCTFTGTGVLPDGWAINAAAGTNRHLYFQSGGSNRFAIYLDASAESGSNVGSTFEVGRYNDSGVYIDSPFTIARATGMVSFPDGITGALTGNASTASKWATGRTIAFTGDVTGTTSAFDGSANLTSQTLTLATVNSAPGACGDATHVCAVTTNGKGLVTAQTATAIQAATTTASGIAPLQTACVFQQQEAAGTNSPDTIVGSAWTQRTLTTTVFNNAGSACTISGNQVTLAAGTYHVRASAVGYATTGIWTRVRVRNVTDSVSVALSSLSEVGGSTNMSLTPTLFGTFTISGSKTFEVEQWVSATTSGGQTVNVSGSGDTEVYVTLEFDKIG